MEEYKEERRKKIISWVIIAILIIIIILLCLTKCCKKDGNNANNNDDAYKIKTGNTDVFNININCPKEECPVVNDDKNNNDNTKNININSNKPNKNNDIPVFDEDTDKDIIGKVFVDDKDGNYIYQQNLNIFNNAAFNYTNKIAPGVSNTYEFKVNNTSNVDIKYYVEMYEQSDYNINLKYRLRRNGSYIIGNDDNWVSADELKTEFKNLKASNYDSFELDWKWFDDDVNDTNIGENMTSEYKLNIRFYFEEIAN